MKRKIIDDYIDSINMLIDFTREQFVVIYKYVDFIEYDSGCPDCGDSEDYLLWSGTNIFDLDEFKIKMLLTKSHWSIFDEEYHNFIFDKSKLPNKITVKYTKAALKQIMKEGETYATLRM